MMDYTKQLLFAINNYDPNNNDSVIQLRDLVCWISDDENLKKDPVISKLLYIASQKMRVFGYNTLNKFNDDPNKSVSSIDYIQNVAVEQLYRSKVDSNNILDKSQQEVIDIFQKSQPHRLLVSAPTSYGKTFLMREIIFLNKNKYNNILLVFPTVALLLENARHMIQFVSKNKLNYKIIKSVDEISDTSENMIFIFTPERVLQLLSLYPEINIDFFFFDEVYKIDEDYSVSELLDETDDLRTENFLNEDRGKTFRIALYLLSKIVDEYYLAGPNLNMNNLGQGMKKYLSKNSIYVKEINFEPTLRISVEAYTKTLQENVPKHLLITPKDEHKLSTKVNDKIYDVVSYIKENEYGGTLLYCTTPSKACEYSKKLVDKSGATKKLSDYPEQFQRFIKHIRNEYDINNYVDEWSLVKVLKNGCGLHHGKLPKYIQQEMLENFNNGILDVLFCTSTIVEGVNTNASNMIILNESKGNKPLTAFDIKNIRGRAGRYHHNFIGRVFYMSKKLKQIEESDDLSLDFVTYSDMNLSVIDLDNADIEDLSPSNTAKKRERDNKTSKFYLTEEVFKKNRMVSKENQEKLILTLMDDKEFNKYNVLLNTSSDVEAFLKYRWISKILDSFTSAKLITERENKVFSAIANNYYNEGFKGILRYEIGQYEKGKTKTIDRAYSEAFKSLKDIIEHKIPKILSLFESIIVFVAANKGISVTDFSLSKVRRFYETGVRSPIGEVLAEYGFPTDAIRRIENEFTILSKLSPMEAKIFCRHNFLRIKNYLDEFETDLFVKVMKTIQ